MRTHKTVKEIKERYNYHLSDLSQSEIDEIVKEILESLKINGVCSPINDIGNKLGFTVYNFPFKKECVGIDKDIIGFLGVGIDFSIHENSNFFLIEKDCTEKIKRFVTAYLISHYLLNINEEVTDFYNFKYYSEDLKNDIETRFALSLLMPKEIFLAQLEFLKVAHETANKLLQEDDMIAILAETFRVTTSMVKARMILINK